MGDFSFRRNSPFWFYPYFSFFFRARSQFRWSFVHSCGQAWSIDPTTNSDAKLTNFNHFYAKVGPIKDGNFISGRNSWKILHGSTFFCNLLPEIVHTWTPERVKHLLFFLFWFLVHVFKIQVTSKLKKKGFALSSQVSQIRTFIYILLSKACKVLWLWISFWMRCLQMWQ